MRYIDIYRKNESSESGFLLVAQDCIQIENANVSRTSNGKSFRMADGSLCIYPAENDTAAMTLVLECSGTQAANISSAVRFGELYFAGLRVGAHTTKTPTDKYYLSSSDPYDAFVGCLPENTTVKVEEIEAAADLFTVRMPLELVLKNGRPYSCVMPVFMISGLSLLGTAEDLMSAYSYRNGIFYRKQTIFTSSEQADISFTYGGSTELKAWVVRNINTEISWDAVQSENSGSFALSEGLNRCFLTISPPDKNAAAYKKLGFQFNIYRQPGIS